MAQALHLTTGRMRRKRQTARGSCERAPHLRAYSHPENHTPTPWQYLCPGTLKRACKNGPALRAGRLLTWERGRGSWKSLKIETQRGLGDTQEQAKCWAVRSLSLPPTGLRQAQLLLISKSDRGGEIQPSPGHGHSLEQPASTKPERRQAWTPRRPPAAAQLWGPKATHVST